MDPRRVMVLCLLSALSIASPLLAAGPAAIVDETCYLRRYYRFATDLVSPGAMKTEGRQVLGDAQYGRLRTATEKSLAASGNDSFAVFRPSPLVLREARKVGTVEALKNTGGAPPAGADWQEFIFRRMFFDPYTAPPPPEDWAAPTFDDSAWVLDRGPFQADMPDDLPADATAGNMSKVHVNVLQFIGTGIHLACYRARFLVDDPAKAGKLTFTAGYRGGLRVLVNGQEVARGHLPQGDLLPDVPGHAYPLAAYTNPALRNRALPAATIPSNTLRPGVNILAIEVRASLLHPVILKTEQSKSWNALHDREGIWRHGFLGRFELRSAGGAAASAKARPSGLHAWTQDMHHRTCSDEPPPPGEPKPAIRLVGPRNGSCSAQLVIVSDKPIAALKVEAGELRSNSAAIPAAAVSILHMMPYPADGFSEKLGDERGLEASFPTQAQLQQHARMQDARQRYIFDHITAQPQPLPAGRSRPLWVSLRIPPAAPAGLYRGELRIQADGQALQVPVEAKVIGWRLPDPKDFQVYAGCEQNPYGVAKQYCVPLWSPEHFRLLEASFRQLGRLGGKWLNVPVIRATEFGNRDDSMIRWIRRKDGTLAYDFAILDKYLDLAVAHLGTPRMINFVVMPGIAAAGNAATISEVMVRDEAGGRAAPLRVGGPGVTAADKRRVWLPFATALHEHLKAKGLERAMHWGYPLDSEVDHELVVLLGDHLPAVRWTGGPHQIGAWGYKEPRYYDVFGTVRYFGNWPGFTLSKGWRNPTAHLAIPRIDSSVLSLTTASHPFAYRVLTDHALALGRAGFTRAGADEWAAIHYDGMRIPTWIVGMPVLFTLWPGPQGAESSARFEALLEGIQEAEARIFLEKALDAGRLPADLARRAADVLRAHYLETTFFQNKLAIYELEQYHYRWQHRCRELFQAAAAVAGLLGPIPAP